MKLSKIALAAPSLVLVVLFTTSCAKLQSRDEMNKGVQSYKNNK